MGEFVARIEDQVRIGSNFRSVFDMTSMCNIRLSFGKGKVVDISQVYIVCSISCSWEWKGLHCVYSNITIDNPHIQFSGWGLEYQRTRVTEVPCWIEISLNGPSQFIDRILNKINPCSEPCDSKWMKWCYLIYYAFVEDLVYYEVTSYLLDGVYFLFC